MEPYFVSGQGNYLDFSFGILKRSKSEYNQIEKLECYKNGARLKTEESLPGINFMPKRKQSEQERDLNYLSERK